MNVAATEEFVVKIVNRSAVQSLAAAREMLTNMILEEPYKTEYTTLESFLDLAWDGLSFGVAPRGDEDDE
jgi:hypothetical protein